MKKKIKRKYRERIKNKETVCITLTIIPRMLEDKQHPSRGWFYEGWTDKQLRKLYKLLYMSGGYRWKENELIVNRTEA